MRERTIERYLKKRCEAHGLLCLKMENTPGIPDRLILLPDQQVVWVETKRPGGEARLLQQAYHQKLRSAGHPVFVLDTQDTVDLFITDLLQRLRGGGTDGI